MTKNSSINNYKYVGGWIFSSIPISPQQNRSQPDHRQLEKLESLQVNHFQLGLALPMMKVPRWSLWMIFHFLLPIIPRTKSSQIKTYQYAPMIKLCKPYAERQYRETIIFKLPLAVWADLQTKTYNCFPIFFDDQFHWILLGFQSVRMIKRYILWSCAISNPILNHFSYLPSNYTSCFAAAFLPPHFPSPQSPQNPHLLFLRHYQRVQGPRRVKMKL